MFTLGRDPIPGVAQHARCLLAELETGCAFDGAGWDDGESSRRDSNEISPPCGDLLAFAFAQLSRAPPRLGADGVLLPPLAGDEGYEAESPASHDTSLSAAEPLNGGVSPPGLPDGGGAAAAAATAQAPPYEQRATFTTPSTRCSALAFHPTRALLYAVTAREDILVWELNRQRRLINGFKNGNPAGSRCTLMLPLTDELLAIGSSEGCVRVWDASCD